jgi:type III secretion protein T
MPLSLEEIQFFFTWIKASVLAMVRMGAIFSIAAFFSKQFITGIGRNIITLAFSLMVIPLVFQMTTAPAEMDVFFYACMIGKEVIVGVLMGFLANFIFYVAQCVGSLIDLQRGSSMSMIFDPMAEEQITITGSFFMRLVTTLFFSSGAILLFFSVIYDSYYIWPIQSYFPDFSNLFPKFFLQIMQDFMLEIVAFAGPLIFILFLTEFGLGLVTRFAPQLNVFFLAMPVKSAVSMFFLVLYLSFAIVYFKNKFIHDDKMVMFFQSFFK